MNLKSCFEQLRGNKNFEDFMKENSSAYLCSGFFTLDKEGNDNKQHFDFFIPEKEAIFSFQLEDNGKMMPLDVFDKRIPEKISPDFDLDFDEIEDKINSKMRNQGINNRIQKLIFSLQRIDGKDILAGTIFLSMFGLLKISIDIKNSEIIDFEKKSLFDMINIFKKNN